MKKNRDFITYMVILIVIVSMIIFLILRANFYYDSFIGHKNYFENRNSTRIEDWMTPHTVLRHFNITQDQFFKEARISNSITNLRTPLNILCKKNNLDCPSLLKSLNEKGTSNGN